MRLLLIPIAVVGALTLSAVSAAGTPIPDARSTATIAPKALPALTTADWAGFRGRPSHAGADHAETTLTPAVVPGLRVLSTFPSLDNEISSQAGATGHGLLFASTRAGALAAYDASSHALRWSATPGSDDIAVGPSAVYTVSASSSGPTGDVTAYDVSTGARLWQRPLTGVSAVNPPTLAGGRLLVTYATTAATNVVLDLNAATGKLTWQHVVAAPYIPSSAAVGSQVVVLTTGNDDLLALSVVTGAQLWSATSKGAGTPSSEPVIANGAVYSGFADGTVRAYTLASGALQWSHALGGPLFGALALSQGLLYATPSSTAPAADLIALRAATGAVAWSTYAHDAGSSPTVADGVVYVSRTDTSAELDAFEAASGTLLARVPLSQFSLSEAMVSHGRVYVRIGLGTTDVLGP